ncbi:MAG: hypothetical protein H0W30_19200, partial [Gemmatimonadaceae bacterium]|nr:hypothetical protein [Gemmatimonadaceae bacterium]
MTTSQEGEPTGAEPPDLSEGRANPAPEVGNYLAMLGWAADSFVHIVAMLILGWWAARQHPAYAAGAA